MLTEKDLKNLGGLTRIDISLAEGKSLLKDLKKILTHFKTLSRLNTEKVEPLSGAGFVKNVFRADEINQTFDGQPAVKQFPEAEKGFLKVPPVFE